MQKWCGLVLATITLAGCTIHVHNEPGTDEVPFEDQGVFDESVPQGSADWPPPTALPPVALPPAPSVPPGTYGSKPRPAGAAHSGAVALNGVLSQSKLVRGGDGLVFLYCGVDVRDLGRSREAPVDLTLVLDVSGSMTAALPMLKEATFGLASRLGEDDHLTVVAYSTHARVIYEGVPRKKEGLWDAVDALEAGGGTDISAGLELGGDRLRRRRMWARGLRGRQPRLLLLTDGLANHGVVHPSGLERLVTGLRSDGLAVSTLGLGTEYDEGLLGRLADAGGGQYHYVEGPGGLEAVYRAEERASRSLVARLATLTIDPRPGVVVEEVFAWPSQRVRGGAHRVRLGDLSGGRTLKVVVRLRLPTTSASWVTAADLRLTWKDARRGGRRSLEVRGLGVELTDYRQVARSSEVPAVKKHLREVRVAKRLSLARTQVQEGRYEDARQTILSVKKLTGKNDLDYYAPDGQRRRISLDGLAKDMADGETLRGRKARKSADEASRGLGR